MRREEITRDLVRRLEQSRSKLLETIEGLDEASLRLTPDAGGWMVFRVTYYADLFPNTFYLKDELDVAQGWAYLMDTVRTYWLHLFLLVNAVGLLLLCLLKGQLQGRFDVGAAFAG